jgi:hypothetical protein
LLFERVSSFWGSGRIRSGVYMHWRRRRLGRRLRWEDGVHHVPDIDPYLNNS